MPKDKGIIAYGTPDDRHRLAAVAKALNTTGSAWIIEQIRARYAELFGDLPPELAPK